MSKEFGNSGDGEEKGKPTLQDIIHKGLSGEGTTPDGRLIAAALLSLNKTATRLLDTLEAIGGDEMLKERQRQQDARKRARQATRG